jgi:hypothetical protein
LKPFAISIADTASPWPRSTALKPKIAIRRTSFLPGLCMIYRSRTEVLRAQANQNLLHLIAKREEQEAEHLVRLCDRAAKPSGRRR